MPKADSEHLTPRFRLGDLDVLVQQASSRHVWTILKPRQIEGDCSDGDFNVFTGKSFMARVRFPEHFSSSNDAVISEVESAASVSKAKVHSVAISGARTVLGIERMTKDDLIFT
jgi:hypothetical protein